MDCHSQSLYVVATVCSSREIGQVELDLIPALVQSHGHCADEGLHSCCWLIVRCSESSSYIFVIEDLNFEGEVFFELSECGGTFLMIMTRKGSLMPRVYLSCWGQVMKAVVTLVPMISRTEDWISWSVSLLMCPLCTGWGMLYFVCPIFEEVCCRWSRVWRGSRIDRYS